MTKSKQNSLIKISETVNITLQPKDKTKKRLKMYNNNYDDNSDNNNNNNNKNNNNNNNNNENQFDFILLNIKSSDYSDY